MTGYPDAFRGLAEGQEFLRQKSAEAIEASEVLGCHAAIIKASMDVIHHFILERVSDDQDVLTVQHLGIRAFNGIAVALNNALTGYYQASAGQQRDLLETSFLLDLFGRDRTLISAWRTLDKKERWARFKPVKVRTELDEQDGFTEKKRAAHYELLSDLAGHPSTVGFAMLQAGDLGAHCGPFFEETAMSATLSELAKLALQAGGVFASLFKSQSNQDSLALLDFREAQAKWLERFYDKPFDQARFDALRSSLLDGNSQIEHRGSEA